METTAFEKKRVSSGFKLAIERPQFNRYSPRTSFQKRPHVTKFRLKNRDKWNGTCLLLLRFFILQSSIWVEDGRNPTGNLWDELWKKMQKKFSNYEQRAVEGCNPTSSLGEKISEKEASKHSNFKLHVHKFRNEKMKRQIPLLHSLAFEWALIFRTSLKKAKKWVWENNWGNSRGKCKMGRPSLFRFSTLREIEWATDKCSLKHNFLKETINKRVYSHIMIDTNSKVIQLSLLNTYLLTGLLTFKSPACIFPPNFP